MTATRTPLIESDVLSDLYADAWFMAQHDVAPQPHRQTVPGGVSSADRWTGDVSDVHAHLSLHPAF